MKKLLVFMGIFALILPLLFLGCGGSGSTGATGAQGPPGPPGTPGGPGAGTATSESCVVCHGEGKIADVAVFMPLPTDVDLAMDSPDVTNTGGFAVITFHLKDATDNAAITTLTASQVRVYMADLVPAGFAPNTESSDYFHRWAYERSTTSTSVPPSYVAWTNFTALGAGDYSITMSTPFTAADNAADVQRLYVRISGVTGYNAFAGFLDFVIPADGVTVTAADLPQYQKAYVTVQTCRKCHGIPLQGVAHGGNYVDTRACVICHSPLYDDPANPAIPAIINASRFYHKIHAAIEIPEFPDRYVINGVDRSYDAVTFPQEVNNCVLCHDDPDGLTAGSAAAIDNWKEKPSTLVCGSCHVGFPLTSHDPSDHGAGDGTAHPGGTAQPDTACVICHPASGTGLGQSVSDAHALTPAAADTPEFDVTISMTPPANGTHYVAGEAPVVTVTLKNHVGGTDVASSVYTTARDAVGVAGGGLRTASLFVYGPRAKSVPVLATNTITADPSYNGIDNVATQGHSLFVGGTDPLVMTDATGFKYQLLAIPAAMASSGTYMIHFEGADYGGVADNNYVTSSTATITFQVGTATESLKVAGDGCLNCHGDTRMHLTGSHAHNVPFNTDDCLACHDQSSNYGDPIANRVHALHSANTEGDIFNFGHPGARDWSHITYPQVLVDEEGNLEPGVRCLTCHTSGNRTFQTNPFEMPCAGCHVRSANGVIDHMLQNGGPYAPPVTP